MSSILRPDDHEVLRKLCNELLPWMIGGGRVRRQWFVKLGAIYAYAGDLGAALAGLGLAPPVVAMFEAKLPADQSALEVLRAALPSFLFPAGVLGVCIWFTVRVIVGQEKVVARALLAKELSRSINGFYVELEQALHLPEPIAKVSEIQASVMQKVQDAISQDIWPFDPPPPPMAAIESELREKVDEYRTKYMLNWKRPAQVGGIERDPNLTAAPRAPADE